MKKKDKPPPHHAIVPAFPPPSLVFSIPPHPSPSEVADPEWVSLITLYLLLLLKKQICVYTSMQWQEEL